MSFFKNIFKNKIKVAGSGGSASVKPQFLMPPDGAFTKIGYQLYEALDLISEGPILGLVDQKGRILDSAAEQTIQISSGFASQSSSDLLVVGPEEWRFTRTVGGAGEVEFLFASIPHIPGQDLKVFVSFVCTQLEGDNIDEQTVRYRLMGGDTSDGGASVYNVSERENVVLGENRVVFDIIDRSEEGLGNFSNNPRALQFQIGDDSGASTIVVKYIKIRVADAKSLRAQKNFNSLKNKIGSSGQGVDKGVYFDGTPLRDQRDSPNLAKYDVSVRLGEEFQDAPLVGSTPERLLNIKSPIKGPYSMAGQADGSRKGTGSRDVRDEGRKNRDFVNWQNFVPVDRNSKPYLYTNYDHNVKKLDVNLQIDALSDTKSFASKSEVKKGKSRLGTPLPLTITFLLKVGKIAKNGVITEEFATFDTEAATLSNGRVRVTGIITSAYAISLRNISLPDLDENDLYNYLEISKVEYETISNLVKRDGGIHSITEKGEEVFLYPNSATVSTSIDSRYYQNVPERSFRLKGKKVLIPSNYIPIEDDGTDRRFSNDLSTAGNLIYSGDWDGSFKFGWTDNPAWIYYDLLINTRYGIGEKLRDVDVVDKWSLYEIGMYCDAVTINDGSNLTNTSGAGVFIGLDDGFGGLEPRFSCNLLINEQKDAIETLQELSRSFRAMTYYNNSSVSVRLDRPHFFEDFSRTNQFEADLPQGSFVPPKELKFPPHLTFNNFNVTEGQFQYSDTDRSQKLSAVEVSYLDKRSEFNAKTEYVEDPEAVKYLGLNVKSVPGLGITSKAQANRMAKYLLFESSNTTETVSFNVGYEALLLEPGDIIQIDDEMRNFSKNFGTVLKTSGEATYFNPDYTGSGNFQTGLGPTSIIVEPSIDSDQLDYIGSGGNIHISNSIGKSGIDEFYKNPTSENSLYQKIHDPQIISLKMVTGGSGYTYDILDEGVAIHIDVSGTFKSGISQMNQPSQWFSDRPANIIPGSQYSIDVSGRNPKYYRVMNIQENSDFGYNVLGFIHHTGKFKMIEENLQFDTDSDTFQPDLKITDISKPNEPSSVTTGAFSSNILDGSLNLPLTITHADPLPGERFVIFLEEPNGNQIISKFDKSSSSTTDVTLSGAAKIDQIGDYEINVFSENVSPVLARSDNATTISFTTQATDFGLDTATDAFVEYKDINILTDFEVSGYDNVNETGFANVSFVENDPDIIATYNMAFEDVFANREDEVLRLISEQVVNIYDIQGNLKSGNFKNLTGETTFTATKQEIDEAFGYTGDGRYLATTGLKFQGNFFTLSGSGDLGTDGQFIQFETDTEYYDEAPMVFVQQVVDGSFEDSNSEVTKQKPIGRVRTTRSGFFVTGISAEAKNYYYFASPTGTFKLNYSTETIEVGQFNKNEASSFKSVTFNETISTTPRIITQLQQRDESTESLFSTTNITGSSTTGFHMNAYDESGNAFDGSGIFGYIATNAESFNILSGSTSINAINITSSGASDINTTGDAILQEYNGSGYRYNNDNQMLFAQKTGTDYSGQFIAIHRTGDENKAIAYLMDTGDNESGIRFRDSDGAANFINVERTSITPTYDNDITLVGWVRFSEDLTGKQYLMEYSNGNTGIAWFQSGDGKNYINTNGVDYKVIDTNINDGNLHMLQIAIDRDQFAYGYLDGAIDFTGYHNIYTGTMLFNNSDAAVDDEDDFCFVQLADEINLASEFDISFDVIFTGWTTDTAVDTLGGAHLLGYNLGTDTADRDRIFYYKHNTSPSTLENRFDVVVSNGIQSFNNVDLDLNEKYNFKITRDSSDDIRLFIDGVQHSTTRNKAGILDINSLGGPWAAITNIPPLNGTMFNVSIKSGASLTEVYKAGGYGAGAESWRSSINGYEYTATISGVPLSTDIALTGDNDGYEDIYPDKTKIKLLGNSTLTGDSLTQGHAVNYLAMITGELVTADYTSDANEFFTGYSGDANTDFIVALSGDNYPTFTDASDNYDTVQVSGEIEKSDFVIDRSALYDFDFIQIGNTGTI